MVFKLQNWANLLLVIVFFTLASCQRSGPHQPIKEPFNEAPGLNENYSYESIRPTFEKFCSACHPSLSPPNLLNQTDVLLYVENGKLLRAVTDELMPLSGSPQAKEFTEEDRLAIKNWIQSVKDKNRNDESTPDDQALTTIDEPLPLPDRPITQAQDKCTNCHGADGISSIPGVPNLAGQNINYMKAQLNDFRTEARLDLSMRAMKNYAVNLTEEDEQMILTFFNELPVKKQPMLTHIEDIQEKITKGAELSNRLSCRNCHANDSFVATNPNWPNLAGQDHTFTYNQLNGFLTGDRANGLFMPGILKSAPNPLSKEDLENLSLYFRSLGTP